MKLISFFNYIQSTLKMSNKVLALDSVKNKFAATLDWYKYTENIWILNKEIFFWIQILSPLRI